MEFGSIHPAVIGIPLGLCLLAVLIFGVRRTVQDRRQQIANKREQKRKDKEEQERQERIKNSHPPEGTTPIRTEGPVHALREELMGAFLLVAIGTYGLNQLGRLLILLAASGLEQIVGSLLVLENNAQLRAKFHHSVLPPVFHNRVVYGFSQAYGGGMSNQPIPDVLEMVDVWGVPVEDAVADVCDLHLRRTASRSPSDVFVFASMGGHAPVGLVAVELLKEQFTEPLVLGFTALPRHMQLRQRFAALKSLYEQAGIFGWVLEDDLGEDPVTSDYGMVALIVGLSDAVLHADQSTQPSNTFRLALTQAPGGILIYQVVDRPVVGFAHIPDPSVPPSFYYVYHQPVVEHILKGLRRLERGQGIWSADLPIGERGTSTFDLVLTSLTPESLQSVKDAVTAGRVLRQKVGGRNGASLPSMNSSLFGKANYETSFASTATLIDPAKPVCSVILIRLTAVRDGAAIVEELVKAPEDRPQTLGKPHAPVLANPTRKEKRYG